MSNFVSPAQVLPSNILRQIIQYGTNSNRNCVYNLRSVSLNWRLAALDYMWKDLGLFIGKSAAILVHSPKNVNQLNLPHYVVDNVRDVEIGVTMTSVVNGTAYKRLAEYLGDVTILPAANKLCIGITDCYFDYKYPKEISYNNVREFSQLIQSLTPAETATDVSYKSITRSPSTLEQECFGTLMSLLGSRSKYTHLSIIIAELTHPSTIDLIPQVTSLEIVCKNTLNLHANLVHRCAKSLFNLDIQISNAKTLFYDANGGIVVYPYLQLLILDEAASYNRNVVFERASVPNVVTLPSLKDLRIRISYPYNDDVLFRGNSASLKRLDIRIDNMTANVLDGNGAFVFEYNDLELTIHKGHLSDNLSHVSDADVIKCIGNLARTAKSLELGSAIPVNYLIAAAPPPHGFESLRVLFMSHEIMVLVDVLRLLNVLPNLEKITYDSEEMEANLLNIADEELPDYIYSRYRGIGKSLQVISLLWAFGPMPHSLPEYVLLLALACPKLCRVEMGRRDILEFQTKLAKSLEKEPYVKYASQLNRLLRTVY